MFHRKTQQKLSLVVDDKWADISQLITSPLKNGLKFNIYADGTLVIEELQLTKYGLIKSGKPVYGKPLKDGSMLALTDLKFVKNIGRGGEAHVNLYIHEKTNTHIAIKEIVMNSNVHEEGESRRKQIYSELRTYTEIVKNNISGFLDIYGVFYDEGLVKIALEYMDSGSLYDFQKTLISPRIPENVLSVIARPVLQALLFLHENLYAVHKDIKPHNILLTSENRAVLADFGILEFFDKDGSIKQNLGTRKYMSPERINPSEFDYITKNVLSFTAGDIWGLGVSILEAALGHHPFDSIINSSIFSLINYFDKNEDYIMHCLSNEFSEDFRNFITLCLKRDPKNRATARQLLEHPFILRIM